MGEGGVVGGRQACHRAALEHVLGLIADAPWSTGLVLRGSMAMTAWVGDAAREPVDLDWIVVDGAVPVDALDPFPFVRLDVVQQWPEAADGAVRYEMWMFEDFDTGGRRPLPPPEGLRWIDDEVWEPSCPYGDLIDLVRDSPDAGSGVILDADEADEDGRWMYALYETPGVRLVIPWSTSGPDAVNGEVQLDFARDEVLPEAPIWTRIPRSSGEGFVVVQAASPELSLAWKLLWLHSDYRTEGRAQGKDLYDAVLLAETGMVLPSKLLTRVLRRSEGWSADRFSVEALDRIDVDWAEFVATNPQVKGAAETWLRRLADSLTIA